MNPKASIIIIIGDSYFNASALSNELEVGISNEISFIDVTHKGNKIRIQRNQSPNNLVTSEFRLLNWQIISIEKSLGELI